MSLRNGFLLAAALLLLVTASACNEEAPAAPPADVGAGVGADATAAAPGAVPPEGDAGSASGASGEPVGMVGSGQATLPPQEAATEPVRPTASAGGIQRAVSLEEAREKVAFVLMEPQVLPENTFLQIIQLVEPTEGATVVGLPAARLIYDVEARGVIVLYQAPAGAELLPGDPITIAGKPGTVGEIPDGFVFAWDADGVHYELRGSGLDRATLLAAAESLAPSEGGTGGAPETSGGASAEGSVDEDGGEGDGENETPVSGSGG